MPACTKVYNIGAMIDTGLKMEAQVNSLSKSVWSYIFKSCQQINQ